MLSIAKVNAPALVIALMALLVSVPTLGANPKEYASTGVASSVQGTGFTYQGELMDGAVLANGNYDLRFRLFDASSSGSLVGSPNSVTFVNQPVSNGLFSVVLDFGSVAFAGQARFVEVGVRPGGSPLTFTVLSPLQPITSVPYAVFAANAAVVSAAPRSFYLSTTAVSGGNALSQCTTGFHMASLFEIRETSTLRYAAGAAYAFTQADSGYGPPSGVYGWIRTGFAAAVDDLEYADTFMSPSPITFRGNGQGAANCSAWTGSGEGTAIALMPVLGLEIDQYATPPLVFYAYDNTGWTNNGTAGAVNSTPFYAYRFSCGTPQQVWCVAD